MLPEIVQFNKWLRRKRPHTSTHVHYTSDPKLFFSWAGKPPDLITLLDIDRYIERCQQLGHAIATVNRRLYAISAFYEFLQFERDDAPPNPVKPKRHIIQQGQRLPRDVQDADIEQLFAVIHDRRDRAMFLLMLRCGLRIGEIRDLSMRDLYLKPSPGSLPRLWVHGKRDAQRVVYLSRQTLDALNAWLEVRPRVASQAVFLNRSKRRFSVTGIQLRLGHYCQEAGIWITSHQLRHTFGRHMTDAGMPITSIQKLLGHKRLRTTQIYTHISDPKLRNDYEAAIAQVDRRLSLDGGAE
jgi:site-specific recombinase XerD